MCFKTLHYLVLIFATCVFLGKCSSSSTPLAPALYVFGDSLFDSGNNNWLPTLAKSNYLPYGINFPKGPTGRFTNGKILPDFIADYLGLPYPPPYIMPFRPETLKGYNYASGACGILRKTGKEVGLCLDLDEQIKLFKRTLKKRLSSKMKTRTKLSEYLAKSIFMFSIGNNDYLGNYFGSADTRRRYNAQQFTQLLIDKLSEKLQILYNLGARKVIVFELGPLGCLQSMVRLFKPKGRCAENVNEIASNFNTQLAFMLNNLTSTLENSHFILGHANWLGYDAIIHPENYGLTDTSNPCCQTWGNGTLTCIPLLPSCSNPNKHFFWDGSHLTQVINALIASKCISGSSVCLPLNIQQLGLCLDLDEQIKLFKRTLKKRLSSKMKTQTKLSEYLAKSIFMFSIGNNDYLGNYFGSADTRRRYNAQQFTQLLIDKLSEKLQILYNLGARKVIVFELGPLGCLQSMVRLFKPKGRCAENVNEIASNFNPQLAFMLNNLTSTLENSHFILGHANWLGYDAIIHPENYGLTDTSNPCCQTWGNGTLTCIPLLPSCSNPNKHFFWDGSHLTQVINALIASKCISGSSVCLPLNIQQLVQP